jgi:hypothetical protein
LPLFFKRWSYSRIIKSKKCCSFHWRNSLRSLLSSCYENISTNIVIDNDGVVELKSNVKTKATDPLIMMLQTFSWLVKLQKTFLDH